MTGNDVIYMFAMSLDGFIAREGGTFDWLDNYPPDDGFDFSAFLAEVIGIVMGRSTMTSCAGTRNGPTPCIQASSPRHARSTNSP